MSTGYGSVDFETSNIAISFTSYKDIGKDKKGGAKKEDETKQNPSYKSTQAKHTFEYDTNSAGIKKSVGTDYVSETTTTAYSTVNAEGERVYTQITSNVKGSVDSDGNISDNVTQTVYINRQITGGENAGNESTQVSSTVPTATASKEFQNALKEISQYKIDKGVSPIQSYAKNTSLGLGVMSSVLTTVFTGGLSTAKQVTASAVTGGGTFLYGNVSPESFTIRLYKK